MFLIVFFFFLCKVDPSVLITILVCKMEMSHHKSACYFQRIWLVLRKTATAKWHLIRKKKIHFQACIIMGQNQTFFYVVHNGKTFGGYNKDFHEALIFFS